MQPKAILFFTPNFSITILAGNVNSGCMRRKSKLFRLTIVVSTPYNFLTTFTIGLHKGNKREIVAKASPYNITTTCLYLDT